MVLVKQLENVGHTCRRIGWEGQRRKAGRSNALSTILVSVTISGLYHTLPLPTPRTQHSIRALTHCKSIISEDGSLLVFLAHFLFGTHNILNVVQCLQLRGT